MMKKKAEEGKQKAVVGRAAAPAGSEPLPPKTRPRNVGLFLSTVLLAVFIRWLLIAWDFSPWLGSRVEISTPVTGLKRLKEGLALEALNQSPYHGDVYHQAPLLLPFVKGLLSLEQTLLQHQANDNARPSHLVLLLCFVAVDVLIAILLRNIAHEHAKRPTFPSLPSVLAFKDSPFSTATTAVTCEEEQEELKSLFLNQYLPEFVAMCYLLNPWTIASCVSGSLLLFNNLAVVASLYFAMLGNVGLCTFALALATYLSFYPVALLIPLLMLLQASVNTKSKGVFLLLWIGSILFFCVWLGALFGLSYLYLQSWAFFEEVYGFILWAPDLTPNIGLFWYYFTEVFTHFRLFFTFLFQYHLFLYIPPLAITLRKYPLFLCWLIMALTAILKSYPTVGDTALYLSILPLFTAVVLENKWSVYVAHVLVFSNVLAPLLWHAWIHQNTGNANFYYCLTLLFFMAQGWLVRDSLTSAMQLDVLFTH
ncbi:Phosphatidylinositol glycan, class U [Balamuthia mandrillaris]